MDESELEISIQTYKSQLEQIEFALTVTTGSDKDDLLKLKGDLTELVHLTEESLLSLKKSKILSTLEGKSDTSSNQDAGSSKSKQPENDMDAEFAAFQAAIAGDMASSSNSNSQHDDIGKQNITNTYGSGFQEKEEEEEDAMQEELDEISGTKCRAPHSHEWGESQYHNAMVVCAEPLEADKEPMVRVLFTHPTHRRLLPCQYFLEGNCRFSEQQCRFSHGHVVPVSELKEYIEPDYSKLKLESRCLARHQDGLWYPGTIVDMLEGHRVKVMFDKDKQTATTNLEDVWPTYGDQSSPPSDEEEENEEDDFNSIHISEDEEEDILPVYLWRPNQTTDLLGEWEKHTKGIGSRLMAKMGYITGQGLGKTGEGRAEPVPIQLLPQGKSLDKIMELKELAGDRDLYDVMKRQKRRQHKVNSKAADGYKKEKNKDRHFLFDFINKKLGKKKGNLHDLVKVPGSEKEKKVHISEGDLDKRSDRHVNIQLMKTHEEIKNVQKEISRIKDNIKRNEGRDRSVVAKYKQKLASMESYLEQLKGSESSLQRNQKKRSDHKKLTIF